MNLRGRMRRYKRIIGAAIIILLTVCMEIGFNYRSLSEGYQELDLSRYMKTEGTGENKNYVVEYQPQEGLFVKQVKLCGIFSEETYTITCIVQNEFGREEEYSVTDTVHPLFQEFYTNLNRRVTSIRITLPCSSGSRLQSVTISNEAELNKYRIVFTGIVFLLLYCIFFEPVFRKKAEYFFLLFSLSFGGLLLLYGQPQCNAWDEQVHFQTAYSLACGKTVEWSEAAEWMKEGKTVKCNTKAEYAQLRKAMNEKGETIAAVEQRGSLGLCHNFIGYLPNALFLKIGMFLELPFSELILFGRMGNLLAYSFVMFWAIRLAQKRKWFLLFISLMPTPVFLACSYTYDSVVFSFVTLGVVLWVNEMAACESRSRKGTLLLSLLLILTGGAAKIVYLPVILIWLMAPQVKQMGKKEKRAAGLAGLTVCAGAAAFLFWYWLWPILNGSRIFADVRGGETDMAGQLFSMLAHPWASIKLFIRDIFSLDNFRNSGITAYNQFFAGNLLFLNYYLLGVMGDKWCIVLLPVITILLFVREKEAEGQRLLEKRQQLFVLLILAAVIGLIWLSMYLVFTPVGSEQISGVQARYYLPVVYFGALAIQNRSLYINGGGEGIPKLAMAAALLLETVSVYDFLLKGRLS